MIRTLAAIVALIVLSGCAGTTSPDSETKASGDAASKSESKASVPKVAAAKGATVEGTGYTYKVPSGWDVPKDSIPGFDLDSLAVDLKDDDGFADNVNVIRAPAGSTTLEEVETEGARGLEATGAKNIKVNGRVSVAGADAVHVTASQSMGDNKYSTDQFFIIRGEHVYIATFSFSTSVSAADRDQVTGAVLASWNWKG